MESVTGMNTIAEKINAEFVIALGDNFYSDGIPTDASDPRFQQTYESVYTGAALQIDWYAISGNHGERMYSLLISWFSCLQIDNIHLHTTIR